MNKKSFWFLTVLGAVVFVGGPLFVQYNHWSLGYRGSGDWLGFWGSYLGVVPSGLIAYLVAKYQIDNNKTLEEKKKFENSLPYAQIQYYTESYSGVFAYEIEYRIASYDGRPLMFKVFLNTKMADDTTIRHEIIANKEDGLLNLNFSASVRSYALEIIMFNGVKVFVTDNNNAQEVIHMYKKEEDNNWKVYGVRPSQNALSESIKNINKMITN